MNCPHCEKGELTIHPGGRMCGCDTCHSAFRYPEMIPFPTTYQGTPNSKAVWELAEFLADENTTDQPKVRRDTFWGKVIATLEIP